MNDERLSASDDVARTIALRQSLNEDLAREQIEYLRRQGAVQAAEREWLEEAARDQRVQHFRPAAAHRR